MPKLTIDGQAIEVPAGTNLIEAARRLGIEIPHYSYHPGLPIAGACRLCMMTVAAAEVAVGLAIIVAIFRARYRINVDDLSLMRW